MENSRSVDLEYRLEDRPPVGRSVLLGIQHLLLMFAPTILAPIVVGGIAGLSPAELSILISATLLASGIGSLIQSKGSLIKIGSLLPVVVGTEAFFMVPLGTMGKGGHMGQVFAAVMIGAVFVGIISPFLGKLMRLFPPIVIGSIITLIGVYLIPIGMQIALDVNNPAHIGKASVAIVAAVTFVLTLLLNQLLKGFLGAISILLAMVIGYIVAIPLGLVDFSSVKNAPWFALPKLGHWGFQMPSISSIIVICVLYLVSTVETIGYITATCEAVGINVTPSRVRKGILGDAVASFIGGALGSTPLTAYAQNVGAISITKVGSRHVVLWTGVVLIMLGLVPKFSAFIGTVPNAVLGGAIVVLFGMVAGVGAQTIRNSIAGSREVIIFSVSLAVGLGFSLINPKALAFLPGGLATALETGVGIGALLAIVLNLVLRAPAQEPVSAKS